MTSKALTWIAVIATIAALGAPNIFAIDKNPGTPVGVPPGIVADYLRAVIMAHRHFYTIHIVNRLRPGAHCRCVGKLAGHAFIALTCATPAGDKRNC